MWFEFLVGLLLNPTAEVELKKFNPQLEVTQVFGRHFFRFLSVEEIWSLWIFLVLLIAKKIRSSNQANGAQGKSKGIYAIGNCAVTHSKCSNRPNEGMSVQYIAYFLPHTDLAGGLLELGERAADEDHIEPLARELERVSLADAIGGTSNDCERREHVSRIYR